MGGVQITIKNEVVHFLRVMWKNARLNGCLDEIELGFVGREATSQFLMMLGIQLYLAGLLLLDTVSILEIFGVKRAR